jgi:type II secretory pathway component PulJ
MSRPEFQHPTSDIQGSSRIQAAGWTGHSTALVWNLKLSLALRDEARLHANRKLTPHPNPLPVRGEGITKAPTRLRSPWPLAKAPPVREEGITGGAVADSIFVRRFEPAPKQELNVRERFETEEVNSLSPHGETARVRGERADGLSFRNGGRRKERGRGRFSREAGFTLIEMVISGAVAALIVSAAYVCLNAAIAGQKLIEPRTEVIQKARVTMAMITADLRVACTLSKDYEFVGMTRTIGELQADNLDFATHNYMPRREREGDYCQTSYFVEKEPGTGDLTLYRRRNPVIAIDPLSGGARELIARGLRGIRYEYFDGYDWYDSWGDTEPKDKPKQPGSKTTEFAPNLTGMPEAVRITAWFNPNPKKKPKASAQNLAAADEEIPSEPPLIFQTVARLNLAAVSQSSADSTGQTGDNNNNNNPTAQPNPTPGVNQ